MTSSCHQKRFILFLFILAGLANQIVFAQCTPPPGAPVATYCSGQYAETRITDPDANARYHWYELIGSEYKDRGYGQDGNGRYYVSTGTVTGPSTYYYSKESAFTVGPAYRAPSGGISQASNAAAYSMPFSTTVDFILNQVTVVVKMTSDVNVYGFQIVYNNGTSEGFSNWFTGKRSEFTALGGDLYAVEIPVTNVSVKKGTGQSLEFRSVANIGQNVAVEGLYWWSATEFNGASYLSNSIQLTNPEKLTAAVVRTPLIMDWQITTLCDKVPVTSVLSSNCCVPVGTNFNVSSSSYISFPATLTASGTDISAAGLFYYWYDQDNTLLGSGQNRRTQSITKPGAYSLRVVRNASDLNTFSCVGRKNIQIENKSLTAISDTTICIGQAFSLSATGAEGNYSWSSTNTAANAAIVNRNSQTSVVNLTVPGTYQFIVSGDVKLNNIAYDGKFEKFDDRTNFNIQAFPPSFETTYGNTTSSPPGAFIVNNNEFRVDKKIIAYSLNSNQCADAAYWQKTDPVTNDVVSRGNIYYADANTSGPETPYTKEYGARRYLWQLSNQSVKPNTDYEFSMDVSNWNPGATPPDIMLLVNGEPLPLFVGGAEVTTPARMYYTYTGPDCQWKTLIGRWNSGSNTSATITVSEVSKVNSGHEFAMDDITFSSGRGIQNDTVIVTVQDCFTITAQADKASVCAGELVNLSATTNGFIQKWEDASGTVIGNTLAVKAYPSANTVYTATALFPIINYFPNSDFSNSNSGIETASGSLTYKNASEPNNGEYTIAFGNETWLYNTYLNGGDHTTGTGTFLLAKVASNTQSVLMKKTISVTAGQSYGISYFIANYSKYPANDGPASISVLINGVPAPAASLTNSTTTWAGTQYIWTAAVTGSVTIDIVSPNESKSKVIALDDVRIGQLGQTKVANVAIVTRDCGGLTARADTSLCLGSSVKLTAATNGFITKWTPREGLSDPTSASPSASPSSTTTYVVEAQFPADKLFLNSEFSNGNNDIISDQTYIAGNNISEGRYSVIKGNETYLNYPVYNSGMTDHTTGTGFFMISNNKTGAEKVIFRKVITAVAGKSYGLSVFVSNMNINFGEYEFAANTIHIRIGGAAGSVIKTFTIPKNNRTWHSISVSWTAAVSGPLSVELVSPRETTDLQRIIGIDDLSISTLGNVKTDSVKVTVTDCFDIRARILGDCSGDSVQIEAETNGLFEGWTVSTGGTSGIRTPKNPTTWVKPGAGTRYVATASIQLGNLIINGDFEQGNTGFQSDYAYLPGEIGVRQYSVSKDPYLNDPTYFVSKKDHTSGTGNMFVSDGGNLTSEYVYRNKVYVENGKKYAFSIWISNVHKEFLKARPDTNQAKTTNLEFVVNNRSLGRIKLPLDTSWVQFYSTFTADTDGEITLGIINRETSQGGNDFVLDDIVVAPLYVSQKTAFAEPFCIVCNPPASVSIPSSVPAFSSSGTAKSITVCPASGTLATVKGSYTPGSISSNTAYQYSWYKKGTPPSYVNSLVITDKTLSETDSGIWVLRVEDYNGFTSVPRCFKEDSVKLIINPTAQAELSRDLDKFCDDGTDEGSVKITVTKPSKASYNIVLNGSADGDIPLILSGTTETYKTSKAQTFTIKSLTDGNNCISKAADLTGSEVITAVTPPVATITEPSSDPKLVSTTGTPLAALAPGAGYTGSWSKASSLQQGSVRLRTGAEKDSLINLTSTEEDGAGKGTTALLWVVTDNSGECKNDTDRVTIIRRNLTPPDAGNDTSVCAANLPLSFKGNGDAIIPGIETFAWRQVSGATPATVSGNVFTLPANTAEDTYVFELTINNSVAPSTLKDSVTIKVSSETAVPVLQAAFTGTSASSPYLLCSSPFSLPGTAYAAPGKNWWESASVTIPAGDSTASPSVTVATGTGSARFYYRNGVCPAKGTDFFYEKVGDITPALVAINGGRPLGEGKQFLSGRDSIQNLANKTADTLCVGGSYTLSTRALKAGETGTWSIITAGTVTLADPLTSPTQNLVVSGPGQTELQWSVKNTSPQLAACPSNDFSFKLVVRDVPRLGRIDGNAFLCEGTDTLYRVNPPSYSTLPVTYTWNTGTAPGALRTGQEKGESTTYKFTSDAAGSLTQGLIEVTPANACGAGALVDTSVTIRLAPRSFLADPANPNDTINGPKQFCAISGAVGYKLDRAQPNVENYSWFWGTDPVPVVTKTTHEDTAFIGQVNHWDNRASTDQASSVKVMLTNRCSQSALGAGILPLEKSQPVTIIAPKQISVTLEADREFCIPDQTVLFNADSGSSFPGLARQYEFFRVRNGTDSLLQVLGRSDIYAAVPGTLRDNDAVRVRMVPDAAPQQCIIYSNPEATLRMEGFDYPPSIIINPTPVICEDNPAGITLTVNRGQTSLGNKWDNGVIRWSRDSIPLPQYDGQFSITLRSIYEGGNYTASIESNTKGCAPQVSRTALAAATYIFEKPEVNVLSNPYAVPATEATYRMPVVLTKPVKDSLTESLYTPATWLDNPSDPSTLLKPEPEEKDQIYLLTLETGNGVCRTQQTIRIIYYLPVIIPNAFSPNGDGLNDNWVITGLGKYPGTKVKVYNRWGTAMFVDNDGYRAVWNGTHNGQPLPIGTYYYIVELRGSPDGTDENRSGSLTIVK